MCPVKRTPDTAPSSPDVGRELREANLLIDTLIDKFWVVSGPIDEHGCLISFDLYMIRHLDVASSCSISLHHREAERIGLVSFSDLGCTAASLSHCRRRSKTWTLIFFFFFSLAVFAKGKRTGYKADDCKQTGQAGAVGDFDLSIPRQQEGYFHIPSSPWPCRRARRTL